MHGHGSGDIPDTLAHLSFVFLDAPQARALREFRKPASGRVTADTDSRRAPDADGRLGP